MSGLSGVARRFRDVLEIRQVDLERPSRRAGRAWLLDPRRLEIVLAAAAYPGVHLRSASRLLLSPLPTLRYHVRILGAHRLLTTRRRDGRVHLFVPGMFPVRWERFLEAWQEPESRRILTILRERGHARLEAVAAATGIPSASASRILSTLLNQATLRQSGGRGRIDVRLAPLWEAFEADVRSSVAERLERFLAVLQADDLHPVVESLQDDRARIVVDGRHARIRFSLPLDPLR